MNINVIRDFRPQQPRHPRLGRARASPATRDWKYVNVRRLLIFIEASIDRGLQWVVFEPNAEPLWARVRRSDHQLPDASSGATARSRARSAEEAFFVKCDRTTMTQTDIDNGRLICVVGVAPVKPAEFVIVRIGLWTAHADRLSAARSPDHGHRRTHDPFRAFNFRVEIDGVPIGAFSEVSGLTADGDAVDYREGTDTVNPCASCRACASTATSSLKRGYTQDDTLWQLVREHRQRRRRPAQRHHRADERGARGRCCAGTSRTPGSTRSRARRSRQRQRGRDGVASSSSTKA